MLDRRLMLIAAATLLCVGPLDAQGWTPMFRLDFGKPQTASVGIGAMRVWRRAGDFSWMRGPLVIVEPGLDAGKLRLGYGVTGSFATGYSLEIAALRAWRESAWSRPSRTYLGAEAHASAAFIDVGIGGYRSTDATHRFRASWSLGLAF